VIKITLKVINETETKRKYKILYDGKEDTFVLLKGDKCKKTK
jgi:hypothetical protein